MSDHKEGKVVNKALLAIVFIVITGIVLLGLYVFIGSSEVCGKCKTVITTKNFINDANGYALCYDCANEQVKYKLNHMCRKCKKQVSVEEKTTTRANLMVDETVADVYCSDACRYREIINNKICRRCGDIYDNTVQKVLEDSTEQGKNIEGGFCGRWCHFMFDVSDFLKNFSDILKTVAEKITPCFIGSLYY
jgi:hypothetical protein